jgi:hypothetical protein
MTKNLVAGGAGRRTQHINHRVAQSAFRAFDFAAAKDRSLNTYVVLRLKDGPAGGAAAFRAVRHKFRDWLSRKRLTQKLPANRLSPVYVYTIESPEGDTHANWAVHIPEELEEEFKNKLPRWVEKVQGSLRPFDLHVQPIVAKYAKRLAKYIVKGINPLYIRHFHLLDVHQPQGEVWGRRAGVSQAIGIKARKRASFHPGKRHYPAPAADRTRVPHRVVRHDIGVERPVLGRREVEGPEGRRLLTIPGRQQEPAPPRG